MTPAQFSTPLSAQALAIFPDSKTFPLLVTLISSALAAWISNPLQVFLEGTTEGLAGVGTVAGFISSPAATGVMFPAFTGAGLEGMTAASLALVFEQGLRL